MWNFTSAGLNDSLKEFFVSLVKTALVAVAVFIGARLANLQVDPMSQYAEVITGGIVIGRALLSAFLKWVNTWNPGQASVPVDGSVS